MRRIKRTAVLAAVVAAIAGSACATGGANPNLFPGPGCYDSTIPGEPDIAYNGFINQLNNAILAGSEDGTCDATGSTPWMLAVSDNEFTAGIECNDANPAWTSAEQMLGLGYSIVETAHLCAP